MAKLIFERDFVLEVGEDTYTGVVRDMTKIEEKKIAKMSKAIKDKAEESYKNYNKIKSITKKMQIKEKLGKWGDIEILADKLEDLEARNEELNNAVTNSDSLEKQFKERFNLTVISDDKEAIIEVADKYGYKNVFETILQDVTEKKEGK